MSNMAYCRFENTYNDLKDCYEVMTDTPSEEPLEASEERYKQKLINLCKDIALDFADISKDELA